MLKAVLMDRTNEKEVSEFNDQMKEWINLYYPGTQQSKEEEVEGMAETFEMLFRGSDGKPRTIDMKVGDNSPDMQIDDYLSKVKKDKE